MKETSTFSDIAVKVLKSGADSLVEGLKAGSGVDQSLLMKSGARRIDKDLRSTGRRLPSGWLCLCSIDMRL